MNLNLPEKRVFIGPAMMWKRILAFVLDLFVLDFFVLGVFGSLVNDIAGGSDFSTLFALVQGNDAILQALTLIFMIIVIVAIAYFTLLQYAVGQTLGMILLNIHTVQQVGEKQFERAGFWQCVLRNVFLIPAVPFIFLWLIDPLYLVFAKKGQRLTEWLSGTKMVEKYTL